MKIRHFQQALTDTLILEPTSPDEGRTLEEYARDDETVTAKIERSPGYKHPCIILQREGTKSPDSPSDPSPE